MQAQLAQFASGTLANMLSRGAAELEDEGATAALLAAYALQGSNPMWHCLCHTAWCTRTLSPA